jgi:hypothetical protein
MIKAANKHVVQRITFPHWASMCAPGRWCRYTRRTSYRDGEIPGCPRVVPGTAFARTSESLTCPKQNARSYVLIGQELKADVPSDDCLQPVLPVVAKSLIGAVRPIVAVRLAASARSPGRHRCMALLRLLRGFQIAKPSRTLGVRAAHCRIFSPWGFPCFVRFPCVHAAATTPAQ